jgi:hypothetical protein
MAGIRRRVAMAAILAMTFGVGGAEHARGQAALLGPGALYIGGGISEIGTGELDDRLAAHGYPTFGRTAGAVSLGAYRLLSSGVMLGLEWHGLILGEETREGREVGLGGGYGTLGVSYAAVLSPRARIYPRLGIGVGGLGLWIENEADSVGFDEVLEDPSPAPNLRTPVLSRDGWVVDVGAGMEYLPSGRGGGTLVGLRLGYLVAPFDARWDFYGRDVSGGPDATISGPYVRAVVGVAWKR